MPLSNFMTATATTARFPAYVGIKRGDPVAHLTGVKITPLMLPDARGLARLQKAGFDGTAKQYHETYSESHAHTDGGSPVTQVPDIAIGDVLTVESVDYTVEFVYVEPASLTGFGKTIIIYLAEDIRV